MEELPAPPESNDPAVSRKARRRSAGDFLQSYLLRRANEAAPESGLEEDDDDEDEETGSRYSLARRFRRNLRRLRNFGGLVEAERVEKKDIATDKSAATEKPSETLEQDIPAEMPTQEFQQQPQQQQAAGPESAEPPAADPTSRETSPLSRAEMQQEQAAGGEEPAAVTSERRSNLPSESLSAPLTAEIPSLMPPPMERTVYERVSAADAPEINTVDSKARVLAGTGLVATGLESLGRRKQDRKILRQIDTLKQAGQQERQRTDRLEQKVSNARDESHRPDLWQQAFERSPLAVDHLVYERPAVEKVISPRPAKGEQAREKAELRPTANRLATASKITPEKQHAGQTAADKVPEVEKLLHKPEKALPPEAVREEVEVAADKNLPLERLYERRHEVKDDPVTAGATGKASASGSSSGTNTPQQAVPVFSMPSISDENAPVPPASILANARIYRHAVLNGLWGAVIVLLIIAVSSIMG